MSAPCDILRQALIGLGLVQMPAIPGKTVPYVQEPGDGSILCWIAGMPDDVDQGLCIYDVPGLNFGRMQSDGTYAIHNGILMKFRALTAIGYSPGYDIFNNLLTNGLDKLVNTTVTLNKVQHYIASAYRLGTITSLGEEVGKKRRQWTINARIAFQPQEPPLG